jgi:hypothetical protein
MQPPISYIPSPPRSNLTTVVGSTAAVIGAVGVTALANVAAPVVAVLITGVSTAVAAGALYRKMQEDRNAETLNR